MRKSHRVLDLFYRLLQGEKISKTCYADEYSLSARSVERDVRTLRDALAEQGDALESDGRGNYSLKAGKRRELTEMEVLYIAKVLLSSRSLVKEEMEQAINAMKRLFPTQIRFEIRNAIQSELDQYVAPRHGKKLLRLQWELNHAIERQLKISLRYRKNSGETVERKVTPVSVVSSEQYLYLVAFREEKNYRYPAFFRLDRIEEVKITDEHYSPKLYSDYNMGRMKNSIQFMYAGELFNVRLACAPDVVEAVLDRLPNSRIAGTDGTRTVVTARVFGEGFLHWAMQYGDAVEILAPEILREKIRETLKQTQKLYEKN